GPEVVQRAPAGLAVQGLQGRRGRHADLRILGMVSVQPAGDLLRVIPVPASRGDNLRGLQATNQSTNRPFLADLDHLEQLRLHTLRAYRHELAAAAADPRFAQPLDDLRLEDLEDWLARDPAAASTLGLRVATFHRFFSWAWEHSSPTNGGLYGGNTV